MIDGLVFPLQSSATHPCDFAGRLHPGINDEPGAGEGCPLLREEKVKKTEQQNKAGTIKLQKNENLSVL